MLLRTAFSEHEVIYANTMPGLAERSGVGTAIQVEDFNAQTPWKTMRGAFDVAAMVVKVRPNVAISTGAAPGLVALLVAKILGCQTIWVDSVANSERLSMSGRLAGRFVDLWLTQWEHLARPQGPVYRGSVL